MTDPNRRHTSPHLLRETDYRRAFWADAVADEIEARDPAEPVVIKGGVSPSGIPHIGHFNEIMRGYYVAEVLRERGHEVRQVFTADDRDRLRKVPRRLATLDGEIVELGDDRVDAGALGRNLGRPYTDIPDPFGCCDSYGDHFTELLGRSAELVGVPVDVVSTTELYESGAFDDAVRHVLEHRETAREVLTAYQDKVDESYVPFQARCENCGKLTEGITAVDAEAGAVEYVCEDVEAGGQTIEGCGHRGTATLREGKLPWRFEWPAQWRVLGVDFEPFGKDHAEGSWPSGEDIARNVFDFEPPVPMVYEWFTLDGRALSSSEGNVVTVHEVLELVEVEVFRYFFTKDPRKQRDFSVERLDRLVDEFDRFERIYFGETDADEEERELAERAYPMVVTNVRLDNWTTWKYNHLELAIDFHSMVSTKTHLKFDRQSLEAETSIEYQFKDESGDTSPGGESLDAFWRIFGGVDWNKLIEEHRETILLDVDHSSSLDSATFAHEASYRWSYQEVYNLRKKALDRFFYQRVRIPYTFAAVLGMTDDPALRETMARRSGHIPEDAPEWAVEAALARVEKARAWTRRTDNEYNYRLAADLPDVDLDEATREALADLAAFVEREDPDGETLQGEIYETARRHGVDVGDFFEAGYRLFLDESEGPRLGPFLAALDREFVLRRLRLEG